LICALAACTESPPGIFETNAASNESTATQSVTSASLNESSIIIASATVYSTASGTNSIGSIGVNENLEVGNASGPEHMSPTAPVAIISLDG